MSQLLEFDAAGNVVHVIDFMVRGGEEVDFEQWEADGRLHELVTTTNRLAAWPNRVPEVLLHRVILNTNGRIRQLEHRTSKVRLDR